MDVIFTALLREGMFSALGRNEKVFLLFLEEVWGVKRKIFQKTPWPSFVRTVPCWRCHLLVRAWVYFYKAEATPWARAAAAASSPKKHYWASFSPMSSGGGGKSLVDFTIASRRRLICVGFLTFYHRKLNATSTYSQTPCQITRWNNKRNRDEFSSGP